MKNYGSRPLFRFKKLYIISDVHGEDSKLARLVAKFSMEEDTVIIFVGDIVDKGPSTLKVLRKISELKKLYPGRVFVIRGNHEFMFETYLKGKRSIELSRFHSSIIKEFYNLGYASLAGDEIKDYLIKHDLMHVFTDMIPYVETEDLIITHAPILNVVWKLHGFHKWQVEGYHEEDAKFPLDMMESDLMWLFADKPEEEILNLKKYQIHGHQSAQDGSDTEPRIFATRTFLDCGCGYNSAKALYAMEWPSMEVFSSED